VFAPAVCAPNEVPGRKTRNVMTVVDFSCVPCSSPAVLGSGNAPASPSIPPGGPGLTWPLRIWAASGRPAFASAAAARASEPVWAETQASMAAPSLKPPYERAMNKDA
jgi:hypothetical protein